MTIFKNPFYQNGVGSVTFRMRYPTDDLHVIKKSFQNRPPLPQKCHIGAIGTSLVKTITCLQCINTGFLLQCIPDYRLRPMVRVFFKPFVVSCPANCYDTVVVPLLSQFTPFSKYSLI